MNREKSLHRWLVGFIVTGTAIMCLVIITISMVLYMRSVRRIYKAEMLKSAENFVTMAGESKVLELCSQTAQGGSSMSDVQDLLQGLAKKEGLSDICLYSFDGKALKASLVACAYPERETSPKDREIVFSKGRLRRLLENEAAMFFDRDAGGKWQDSVFYPVRDEQGSIQGLIRVSIHAAETFDARVRFFMFYAPVCILLIVLFAIITSGAVRKRIIVPLTQLNKAALEYSGQDAQALAESESHVFDVPEGTVNDEIGTLWRTFDGMEKSLGTSIRSLKEATSEIERKAAEVNVASQIQLGMLPDSDPSILGREDFGLCGSMSPAKGVGGDFYDYFFIDDDHLALVLGDVSGKGIPAALFMMMSITQIRTQAIGRTSPSDIMREANRQICRYNPEMMFVTVWLGVVELSTGILKECNAGHEYPAVLTGGGDYVLDLTDHDMPLGLMEDIEFCERQRELLPGNRVFIYSDGLPEAVDESDEQFGTDRMIKALNEAKEMADEALLMDIKDRVSAFAGGAEQFDDLTMLSFTYR